jgi:tetratricopeptide (TPR) repeat protein
VKQWRDSRYFWETLVFSVAVLLFLRTVWFGWVYDDEVEIVANTHLRTLTNLRTIFTTTAWAGSGIETFLYRPLTNLSYALNYAVSGLAPWSYRLVNVLLHATITVLVCRLGRLWRLSPAAAGMGALLFAVHPVHVEVVAGVVGRRDLLAAVFTLWMVLAHRTAVARDGWRMVLPVVAFAGAMLSKEVGVVAVALVAAQDWLTTPADRRRDLAADRGRLVLYASYLFTLAGYLLVRSAVAGGVDVLGTHPLDNPLVAASAGTRVATALAVLGKGLQLLVAPIALSPDYSYDAIPLVTSPTDWRLWSTLALLAILLWAATSRRVRELALLLAVTWYAIAIVPGSNLLLRSGTIFGERLLYLPSVAACLAGGYALVAVGRRQRQLALALGLAAIAAFSAQTVRYSAAWRSNLTLFEWAVRTVPNSTKAHHKLGEVYYLEGRTADAIRELERALEIAPGNTFAAQTLATVHSRSGPP